MNFPEDVLHHIWQFKLYDASQLATIDNHSVKVLNTGVRNTDQGPDFSNARIKINTTEWAGNVEIHKKTSDWYKHGHQNDSNYQNIILHVVFEHDAPWNYNIPLLELKNFIPESYLSNINNLLFTGLDYCKANWQYVDEFTVNHWLQRMAVEKLQEKQAAISEILSFTQNNWDETFYIYLATYFGMKVNNLPFKLLAQSLPLKIIEKHADNPFQVEALLFGQAGLLQSASNSLYAEKLLKEYNFLQAKYALKPLDGNIWKFSKMRPTAFPTVKMAQLVRLLLKHTRLFQEIIKPKSLQEYEKLFNADVSEYWKNHYTFGNESKPNNKQISRATIRLIIINVVIPVGFAYAEYTANSILKEHFVNLLAQIAPETNKITKQFTELTAITSATQTQGLNFLYNNYCLKKQCLNCAIGNKVLKTTNES